MATSRKKPDDGSFVGRLAGKGEDAVNRLVDELGKNPRVTDALGKAMSAKGRVDSASKRTLSQIGLAAADELKDLRKQIERLERRLARLEGGSSSGSSSRGSARRSETKKKPTTRKRTTTAVKKDAKKASSPAPGRSIGGGPGRGSSPGGGAAA
jgi:polyhydroxyalkanoate synthesis regulator phasin